MPSDEVQIVGHSELEDIRFKLLQGIGIFCVIGMAAMLPVLGVTGSGLFVPGLLLLPLGIIPALGGLPYRLRVGAVIALFILIAVFVVAVREAPIGGRLWIVVAASLAAVFLGLLPGVVSLLLGLACLALPYYWLKYVTPEANTVFIDNPRDWFVQISSGIAPGLLLIYSIHFAFNRMIRAEARSRIAMDNAVDMIWTCSMDRRFTFVTPSVEDMLGYTAQEMLSMNLSNLVSEEILAEIEAQLLRQGEAPRETREQNPGYSLEVALRHKDGSMIWTENSMKLLRDIEGHPVGVSGISRDISARKQAEDTEATLVEQLHQAQKMESIGMLAGGVAHDFNNLLGVMMGNADLIRQGIATGDQHREYLDEILKAGNRATALTRQLLLFSRKEHAEPHPLNLNDLVDNLASMLERLMPDHIEFRYRLADDLPTVMADPGQLEQVIVNLAVNARDAIADQGHIDITTEYAQLDGAFVSMHRWARVGDFAVITVSDDGCGIAPEHLSRIFEPFYSSKTSDEGTGLGLAVVFGIVQQHDGFLHVHSDPGTGTEFSIYLPVVEASSEPLVEPAAESAPGGTETILLVEDDDALRRLAERILTQAGYRVLTANNGEAGVDMLRAHGGRIDLVFSDVVMPKLNGPEMMATLARERPDIRVLYATGYTSLAMQERYFSESTELLHKPYGPDELLNRIRQILDAPTIA